MPATRATDAGTLEAGVVYRIDYSVTTPGPGTEAGSVVGYWDGDVDYVGKLTIVPADGRPGLYLFPDEIEDLQRVA